MDKKLLDALAAKAEQRKADKAKVIQFKVGGQLLDFVVAPFAGAWIEMTVRPDRRCAVARRSLRGSVD